LLLGHLRTALCKRIKPDNWAYLRTLPDDQAVAHVAEAEDAEAVPVARLDLALGPRDGYAALLKLRRDYSGTGLRFPFFDFAVVTHLHRSRQLTDERLQAAFPSDELALAAELAVLVGVLPGAQLVAAAIAAMDQRLGGWFRR
jgi:hypothetical protein